MQAPCLVHSITDETKSQKNLCLWYRGMAQTDRQTDKTTRWAFTAFEDQWGLFNDMPDIVAEWGWQTEVCPDTGRKHYQGYLRTRNQQRFTALRKVLPGVHIEPARNWEALMNYCKKTETAVNGSQHSAVNTRKYLKFHEALIRIANAYVDTYQENVHKMATLSASKAMLEVVDEDKKEKENYQRAVSVLCSQNPEDISLYSNPQMFRAWTMCKGLWLRMSACVNDICSVGCECDRLRSQNEEDARQAEKEEIAKDFFSGYGIELDA